MEKEKKKSTDKTLSVTNQHTKYVQKMLKIVQKFAKKTKMAKNIKKLLEKPKISTPVKKIALTA